ncbi:PEP-CTERM sorting domain-containing protein [Chitinibacteraceae bacterium HSL-7]
MMKNFAAGAMLAFCTLAAGQASAALVNGSFESNNVGGGYSYAGWGVQAEGWQFAQGAGVSANGTAWYGTASAGNYFGFLQGPSSISQNVVLDAPGNVSFSFDLAQRSAHNSGGAQVVQVLLNGALLGSFTPFADAGWDRWSHYSVNASGLNAGSYVLSFVGITNNGGDTAAFLDNVSLAVAPVPEPSTYALMGLGLAGLVFSRRRKLR